MSNYMLSDEKAKSILMPSQDIMLLLYSVFRTHRDLVSASFKCVHIFFLNKS